jgi:predicted SnoaL-like aldol condensation-catalyzing enzyme
MNRCKFLMLGCAALGGTALFAQGDTAQESKNQRLAMNWYREVIAYGHVELAPKYMADDYAEHDPTVGGADRAAFVKFHSRTPAQAIQPNLPKQPVKAFAKGDFVVMVWDHQDKDPSSGTPYTFFTYDVVRVKNGKIQEHWDNLRIAP